MRTAIIKTLMAVIIVILCASSSSAFELMTRYSTIRFSNEEQLRKFNRNITLGSLSFLLGGKRKLTVSEEMVDKIDVLIERVQNILEMYPAKLALIISLERSDDEVQRLYRGKYGRDSNYIAFYAPRENTIYISVNDAETGVLAHEIAHAVIDLYYGVRTPSKIHEVLAQYVEEHLRD